MVRISRKIGQFLDPGLEHPTNDSSRKFLKTVKENLEQQNENFKASNSEWEKADNFNRSPHTKTQNVWVLGDLSSKIWCFYGNFGTKFHFPFRGKRYLLLLSLFGRIEKALQHKKRELFFHLSFQILNLSQLISKLRLSSPFPLSTLVKSENFYVLCRLIHKPPLVRKTNVKSNQGITSELRNWRLGVELRIALNFSVLQ